jgi:hypothetical protein
MVALTTIDRMSSGPHIREEAMRGFEISRVWQAGTIGLALLAAACGGGGDATGPGGPTAGTYQLVSTNGDMVPAIEQTEHCSPSRFKDGFLTLTADGGWQMSVELDDETGSHVAQDHGQYQQDGGDLSFDSVQFGDSFDGEIEGQQVVVHYDFCANGVADTDFEFER